MPTESSAPNRWVEIFTSSDNRHALPLFTSLLNTVCAYKPSGFGVPYNHLLFTNQQEPLVEVALQILITSLDHDTPLPTDPQEVIVITIITNCFVIFSAEFIIMRFYTYLPRRRVLCIKSMERFWRHGKVKLEVIAG